MFAQHEVVVVGSARTAIGDYGGGLKDFPPTQLGGSVVREAFARAAVKPNDVGMIVFGNGIHSGPQDSSLSRVAAIEAGLSFHALAVTVNHVCGSGLQAILMAAQSIALGATDLAVAGGAESRSRGGYLIENEENEENEGWGQRMGNAQSHDRR
jgi:acetyl-CoA C-acetyltransferase